MFFNIFFGGGDLSPHYRSARVTNQNLYTCYSTERRASIWMLPPRCLLLPLALPLVLPPGDGIRGGDCGSATYVATAVLWCLNCHLREAAGVDGRQAAPNGWWVICAWASNQIQVRAQQARIIVMQLMWRSTTDICLLTMYNKLPTVYKPMVWPTDGQTGS